jgi:hypothetical protein
MKDFFDNIDVFKQSQAISLSNYRKSLYSDVTFDKYHKETSKGHVIYIKQYRKDFYKPSTYDTKAEGFFGFNQMMRNMRMEHLVAETEDEYKNVVIQLRDLFKEGFVLCNYEMKTIKALQYVDKAQLDFIKQHKMFPGHIRSIKHSQPQYDGHKALETNDGRMFYYRTSWSSVFKPDLDMTAKQQKFNFEEDELVEQGTINVVSNPEEEPLIIEG